MMETQIIKENLLKLLLPIELDINIIQDFQTNNPITQETLLAMNNITKAKLGMLNFKIREYITKFKTICYILESEFSVDLKNTLTKGQMDIYLTQQEGSAVIIKETSVEFDTSIPGIGELLNSMN